MLVWQSGKTPLEVDDFTIDWTLRLGTDTLATSTWSIVHTDGTVSVPTLTILTNPASSNTTTVTKVWLSGGTAGYAYVLQNLVTTAAGETLVETVQLQLPPAISPNNLTTLANTLQWVGLGADPQYLVSRLITSASTEIQNFLGYLVLQSAYSRSFSGEGTSKLFVPDLPLVSVQSLTIDGFTVPQGQFTAGSQQAGYYNDAHCIGLKGYIFSRGFQNIQASYTSGYATVPPDIEQACLDWIKISLSNQSMPGIGGNAISVRAGDTEINWGGKGNVTDVNLVPMPSDIYRKLKAYRREATISGYSYP